MKKLLLFLAICLIIFPTTAQNAGIKGKLVSGNTPVEYANIVLQRPDSSFVTGLISDQRGNFTILHLEEGDYLLSISCIGYEPNHIQIDHLITHRDLGMIPIETASINLEEITVTAAHSIHTIDKKIILPTARQVNTSTDGLNLLQQMKLDRLYVNPFRKTVTTIGEEEVQLRVNGVKAEIHEVLAIHPRDVIRIEYHDTPSLRYGEDPAAIVNYIVRHKETGGSILLKLENSPHTGWGNNNIHFRINHKKSEFALNYYNGYRILNWWRLNEENFTFADEYIFTRLEEGIPNKGKEMWQNIHLNYSYHETDKWFFNISIRGYHHPSKLHIHSKLYPKEEPDNATDMKDYTRNNPFTPSVELYFQRNLRKEQYLILNAVSTYIASDSKRTYQEKKAEHPLTDIFSSIHGDHHSFIGEGIYEKGFNKSKLSSGLYFRQSHTNNTYKGTTNARTELQESLATAYTEYTGIAAKFSYSAGIRGSRTHIKQGSTSYNDFSLMPQIRLSYQFNDHLHLRYRGSISQATPALADLGNVEQLIDSLQMRRGNPDLKISTHYNTNLYVDYRKGLFSSSLSLRYDYQHQPMMESIYREKELFISIIENQKSWQQLTPELELKFGPVKDILELRFTTGLHHFKSHGNAYKHVYNNWYYLAEVSTNYKEWSFFTQFRNHRNHFRGETIYYGENLHITGAGYRYKQMTYGIMVINPFIDNYRRGSENFNHLASSENRTYLKESFRLFLVTFSWNFSFGRSVDSVQKRLNHEDNDPGLMKSGK